MLFLHIDIFWRIIIKSKCNLTMRKMYRTVFLYKIELNMYAKNKGERERRLII